MSEWTVTEEAVAAMQNMTSQLQALSEQIKAETQQLKTSYEENQDGLGYHSAKIQTLIEEVEETEEAASRPVLKLVLKLTKAAIIRKAHMETDSYQPGRSR